VGTRHRREQPWLQARLTRSKKDIIMNTAQLKAAASRLANADVGDHVARAAAIAQERRKVETAIEEGQAKLTDIGRRIADARMQPYADPDQAADALLSRSDITSTVDTVDTLNADRIAVQTGMKRLSERSDQLGAEESTAKNAAVEIVAASVGDVAPLLREAAKEVAENLAAIYAAAVALARGTASMAARGVADDLSEIVAQLDGKRFVSGKTIPVPSEILSLLAAGKKTIDQIGRGWPTEVDVPQSGLNHAAVVATIEANQLREQLAALRPAPNATPQAALWPISASNRSLSGI
jgi:hypothetical protein